MRLAIPFSIPVAIDNIVSPPYLPARQISVPAVSPNSYPIYLTRFPEWKDIQMKTSTLRTKLDCFTKQETLAASLCACCGRFVVVEQRSLSVM
jgi:hypothetical protein